MPTFRNHRLNKIFNGNNVNVSYSRTENRVGFNDSWFVFRDPSWSFHENTENTNFTNQLGWTEHEIMVLKSENKYKIIRQFHNFENIFIDDLLHHPILYRAKVL